MGKGIEACAPMNFGTHFRGENLKSAIFSIGFPNPGSQGSVRKASRAHYCMHPNTVRGIETAGTICKDIALKLHAPKYRSRY